MIRVLFFMCCITTAQSDDLAGIWEGQLDFGPRINGPILMRNINGESVIDVGAVRSPVKIIDNRLQALLPSGLGRLEGWREGNGWKGHWIQPATAGLNQEYASPLTLSPGPTAGVWHGVITPLSDHMTFHFVVSESDDGLGVFLRNPDRNLGRLLRFHSLTVKDEILEFMGTTPWTADTHALATGRYHEPEDQITLTLPGFATALTLRRVTEDRASSFYTQPHPKYRYAAPPALEDGWKTKALDVAAEGAVSDFLQSLLDATPDSPASPDVHAFLIAHNGKLVVEEYFHGHDRESAHDTRSASKSLTTVLVGAAMHAGEPVSLDHRMVKDATNPKHDITLEHLATMSSGLDCDDWNSDSAGGEDRMQSEVEDWYGFTRSLSVVHPAGANPAYCSGGMNLVGEMLALATGKSLMRLFSDYIADPLSLEHYYLNLSPTGQPYMGGGIRWRARDFLKLGQLVLDEGVWNGERILDVDFARLLITPRFPLGTEGEYALGWWVRDYAIGSRKLRAFFAGGNGGQILMGFPELDLVVLFYGGNYGSSGTFAAQRTFIPESILPAFLEPLDDQSN